MKTKLSKNKMLFLVFILFLLSISLKSYAGPLEEELRNHIELEFEAWNNKDIDKLASLGWAGGFGFRSMAPRPVKEFTPEFIQNILRQWFSTVEYYKLTLKENNIVVDGDDIGLFYGFHIEEIKHIGQPAETIKVRSSATYRRDKSGVWRQILGHRDIQPFQANGQYIRVYEK